MSDSPIAFYKKETGAICSFPRANCHFALSLTKNQQFAQKNSYFSSCFCQFLAAFPLFMRKSKALSRSYFLKSDTSNLLSSLFIKEQLCANCSRCSLQKSNREQLAPVALYKRAMGAICSFRRANQNFALSLTKNERTRSKNRANS